MDLVFEVFLSPHQEDGFIVTNAASMDEAVDRTIRHAIKKHPGLFDKYGNLKDSSMFPLVYEINRWQ